jgi:hypothetical protein
MVSSVTGSNITNYIDVERRYLVPSVDPESDLSELAIGALVPVKNRYVILCGDLQAKARSCAVERTAREQEVARVRTGLKQAISQVEETERQISELQHNLVGSAVFERELEELLALPDVVSVSADNHRLVVETRALQVEQIDGTDGPRNLGCYRLVLDLATVSVTITNISGLHVSTDAISSTYRYDHPHVRNFHFVDTFVRTMLSRYLREKRPYAAVLFCLEALKTVSTELGGVGIKRWPASTTKGGA